LICFDRGDVCEALSQSNRNGADMSAENEDIALHREEIRRQRDFLGAVLSDVARWFRNKLILDAVREAPMAAIGGDASHEA